MVFPRFWPGKPLVRQHFKVFLWKTTSPLDRGDGDRPVGVRRQRCLPQGLAWLRSSRGSDGTGAPGGALTGWGTP